MNRNDNGPNYPHRSGYNRTNNNNNNDNNKQHYNRQNQLHRNLINSFPPPYHQIQPFDPVQQFSPFPFIQQETLRQQQQQYLNQHQNHPQQYLHDVSLSRGPDQNQNQNQNQNIQCPYDPTLINPTNSMLNTPNWFNPESQAPIHQMPLLPNAVDQMSHSIPLGQLQLPANQITDSGIIPNAPYYELPAGLMVPLITADQKLYKPLDPNELRLPLPKFPDENFLRSIDSYYGSDGRQRDNDGWDSAFINTFIGQKAALAESQEQSSYRKSTT